jgi:hypothetical protein
VGSGVSEREGRPKAAPAVDREVRVDDAPWQPATLVGERHRHGWQWWQLSARLARPGGITIRSRATDLAGRTQPDQPQWNPLGYANNAVHEVRLAVDPLAVAADGAGEARYALAAEGTRAVDGDHGEVGG